MTNPFIGVDPGPWLHTVAIVRKAAGGTTDPTTGHFVEGGADEEIVVAGAEPNADCQDERKVLRRDASGTPTLEADATIFLRDEALVLEIEEGMTGTVSGEEYGAGHDFEVIGTKRLDGSIYVSWL